MRTPLLSVAIVLTTSAVLCAQRTIEIFGAPVVNKTFRLQLLAPAASINNPYILALSPHTDLVTKVPGLTGDFLLHPTLFIPLVRGTLTSSTVLPLPIPNDIRLAGLQADFQYLEGARNGSFLSNEIVVTVLAKGIGTAVVPRGSTTSTVGFTINTVQNSSVGSPVVQNKTANWDREQFRYTGLRGWVQGRKAVNRFTDYSVDPHIYKRGGKITYGNKAARSGPVATILPNGKGFLNFRDSSNTGDFFCATIDYKTGVVREITGSRFTSQSTAATPGNAYSDYFAFSADGNVAVGVVDYSSTTNSNDELVLIRTDGQTWNKATGSTLPGNTTETIRVTSTGGWHAFATNYAFVANEVVIFAGVQGGTTGTRNWMWAPLDGSALAKPLPFPVSGTNVKPHWFHTHSKRVSKDLKTVAIPRGHNSQDSSIDHDVYALTNVGKTNMKVVNISAFPANTVLRRWWSIDRFKENAAASDSEFNATLSDDGKRLLFIGGAETTAFPNVLYLAPTDGSQAGKLKPLGKFPTGTLFMHTPHFLPTGNVVVFAGKTRTTTDAYLIIPSTGATTNLTKKGNIDASFTLVSDNGRNLYFGRDYDTSNPNQSLDLARIDLSGRVFNVTGNEFAGVAGPGPLELMPLDQDNEFRLRPGNSTEMYFIGRPVQKSSGGTTFFDANVYKFDFENGGVASRVTNYTGSSKSRDGVINIENLVVLTDGSVVYAANKGLDVTKPGQAQRVTWHKGDGSSAPVVIGRFVLGPAVNKGSIEVEETNGGVYWVQSDNGTNLNTRAYHARIDDLYRGHPLNITGVPTSQTRGLMNILGVSTRQN